MSVTPVLWIRLVERKRSGFGGSTGITSPRLVSS
jgi:hypothetical protein